MSYKVVMIALAFSSIMLGFGVMVMVMVRVRVMVRDRDCLGVLQHDFDFSQSGVGASQRSHGVFVLHRRNAHRGTHLHTKINSLSKRTHG